MKKSRIYMIGILAVVGVVFFSLIYIYSQQGKVEKNYDIIYIPKVVDKNNDFWTSLIAGANMAAEEYGSHLQVVAGENESDVAGQSELIDWAIKQKPDAIAVSPCSYTETLESLKKVRASGILLVLIDSVVKEPVEDITVATDNEAAGEKLGKYGKDMLKKESEVVIVGHVKGTSTAIEREAGIRKGLGDMEPCVKEVVFCGSEYGKAYELTLNLIDKYPKLNMIFGLNEYSAVGAARAIRDSGLKGKIKMIGFDSSITEIQLMEEGVFSGIVIQKPFNMGYLGIEQTIKSLSGMEYEKSLDSGSKLITMDNLYTEENQKLLFPFVEAN